MAKSKPSPDKTEELKNKGKNERIIRILDKLRGTAAPTLAELADEAKYALPDPLVDSLMGKEKKSKFKYF